MASLSQYLSTLNKDRRLAVALPVKVISNEIGVAPQWSCTYEISRRGARLKHVRGVMVEGQEIWLKRLDVSAKYRVTWIGKDTGSSEDQFAAECMEDTTIWEDEISGKLQPLA